MENGSCLDLLEKLKETGYLLTDKTTEKEIDKLPLAARAKVSSSLAELRAVFGEIDLKKVSIRPYMAGELGYIAWRHSFLYRVEYGFGDIFEFYLIQGMYKFLEESGGKGEVWVLDHEGTVQGSVAIVETGDGTAQLRWFFIEPEFRGLGLGKKLMDTCMSYCRDRGYNNIYLWTFDELDAARHLYERYGFRVTEKKTHNPWGRNITEERWDLNLQ